MTLPTTAHDLPPTAKLCYRTLERADDGLTQQEICELEHIPRRTAYDALETLECHDLVRVEHSTADARQDVYLVD